MKTEAKVDVKNWVLVGASVLPKYNEWHGLEDHEQDRDYVLKDANYEILVEIAKDNPEIIWAVAKIESHNCEGTTCGGIIDYTKNGHNYDESRNLEVRQYKTDAPEWTVDITVTETLQGNITRVITTGLKVNVDNTYFKLAGITTGKPLYR